MTDENLNNDEKQFLRAMSKSKGIAKKVVVDKHLDITTLIRYAEEKSTEEEKAKVLMHLSICKECTNLLENLKVDIKTFSKLNSIETRKVPQNLRKVIQIRKVHFWGFLKLSKILPIFEEFNYLLKKTRYYFMEFRKYLVKKIKARF